MKRCCTSLWKILKCTRVICCHEYTVKYSLFWTILCTPIKRLKRKNKKWSSKQSLRFKSSHQHIFFIFSVQRAYNECRCLKLLGFHCKILFYSLHSISKKFIKKIIIKRKKRKRRKQKTTWEMLWTFSICNEVNILTIYHLFYIISLIFDSFSSFFFLTDFASEMFLVQDINIKSFHVTIVATQIFTYFTMWTPQFPSISITLFIYIFC